MSIQPVFLECGDCGECHLCSPGPESFGWEARPLERGEAEPPLAQVIGRCTRLPADRWPEELQVFDVRSLPPGTKWARAEMPPSPAIEVLCLDCGELAAPDSCRCRRG